MEMVCASAQETHAIGRALGEILQPGDVVALTGDLGAGKTVFCKGVGEALGVSPDRVVSPSFTIVTEHAAAIPLYHIDVYRFSSEKEAEDIGLEEILGGQGACLVEWAEKIDSLLPNHCIKVTFHILEGDGRRLAVEAPDSVRFERFRSRCSLYTPGG